MSNNKDNIYKPADKGGGFALINRKDYELEVLVQFADLSYYT